MIWLGERILFFIFASFFRLVVGVIFGVSVTNKKPHSECETVTQPVLKAKTLERNTLANET